MNDFSFEATAHTPQPLVEKPASKKSVDDENSRKKMEQDSQEMLQALRDEYEIWDETHPVTQKIKKICTEGKTGKGLFFDKRLAEQTAINVLVSDQLTAFVFFGAHTAYLVVSTALINSLKSEDALAAVLAHEVGHIEQAGVEQKEDINRSTFYKFENKRMLPNRAKEMLSDTVTKRLDRAGYYSRAWKELTNAFLRELQDRSAKGQVRKFSDASHGDLYDRQQIDDALHLLEDYQSSECEPTALDSSLQSLPIASSRFNQILHCVEQMLTESALPAVTSQRIEGLTTGMSLDGLINTFKYVIKVTKHDLSMSKLGIIDQLRNLHVKLTLLATLQQIIEQQIQQKYNCSENESLLLWLLLDASSVGETLSEITVIPELIEMYKKGVGKKSTTVDTVLIENRVKELKATLQTITIYQKIIALRQQHTTWLSFLQAIRRAAEKTPDLLANKKYLFRALHLSMSSTYEYRSKLLYLTELKPLLQRADLFDDEVWQKTFVDAVFDYFDDCRVFDTKIMNDNMQTNTVYCLTEILQRTLRDEVERIYKRDPDLENDLIQNREQSQLVAQLTKCYVLVAQQIRERLVASDPNHDLTLTNLQRLTESLQELITASFSQNSVAVGEKVIKKVTQSLIAVHPKFLEAIRLVKNRAYIQAFALIDHGNSIVSNLFDFLKLIQDYDDITPESIDFVHGRLLQLTEDELRSPAALRFCDGAIHYPDGNFGKLIHKFGIEGTDRNRYWPEDELDAQLQRQFSSVGTEDLRVLLELFLINELTQKVENAVAVDEVSKLMNSLQKHKLTGRLLFTCFSSIHVLLELMLENKMLMNLYDSQNDVLKVWYRGVMSHPLVTQMRAEMLSQFKTLDVSDRLQWLRFIQSVLAVQSRNTRQLNSIREFPLGKQVFVQPFLEVTLNRVLEIDWVTAGLNDLYDLHQVAPAFLNRRETRNIQSGLEMRIVQRLSLSQSLQFVEQLINRDIINPNVLEYIQSQLVNTGADLEEFDMFWEKNLTRLLEEKKDSVDLVSYADMFVRAVEGSEPQTIFSLCVESHDDDSKLRETMVDLWFDLYCDPTHERLSIGSDDFSQKRQFIFRKIGKRTYGPVGKKPHLFVPFTEFMTDFYSQITDGQRAYILRRLLLAEHGLLVSQEGRKTLIEFLRKKLYAANESGAMAVFANDLIEILLSVDKADYEFTIDPLTLVRPLTDLLTPFCLQSPERAFRPRDNFAAARLLARSYNPWVNVQNEVDTGTQYGVIRSEVRRSHEHLIPKLTPIEAMALLQAERPEQPIHDALELKIAQAQQVLLQLTGIEVANKPKQVRTYSELEILVTIAESKGILGARFLQLLETYISLPESIRERVLKAQDRVTRQLKITAMRTLRRECTKENANQFMQYFWQNLVSVEDTPNGGSLMRLLKAHLSDGTTWAVKVLTPNAIDTIRTDVAEVREVIALLRQIPRYAKSKEVGMAEILINDLERFILNDISCVEYEEKDRQYRELHAGRELSTNFGYVELAVPFMPETGSKYVKIEQWVDGESFVRWRETAPAEHVSAASQLIKEDFIAQITTPVAATKMYMVHPDIYGGNLMISKVDSDEGGQLQLVVWQMDRGLYLEFSEQEVGFCRMLHSQSFTIQNVMQFIQCLLEEPENRRKKTRMLLKFAQLGPSALFNHDTDRGTGLLVSLRQNGLHVPLKWSLFMRGSIWLNKLSLSN